MTTSNTFTLQVQKEDLMGLYNDQIRFKLFSKEYAGRIFFIAVALILTVITLVATFYSRDYVFYLIVFLAGVLYCVHDIWSSYTAKRKKRKSVEEWADHVLLFQSHQLSITEEELIYQRDAEVFRYSFDGMNTHDAPEYFQVLAGDGSELLLPKKAFTAQDYDRFTEALHRNKR